MAYFDSKTLQIVYRPPRKWSGYRGWLDIDCGCCNGIQWGGEDPRECRTCEGTGRWAVHVKSGLLKLWPGGSIIGSMLDTEVQKLVAQVKEGL
jgi:hypothetical protein